MITTYLLVKWLHILSSTVLFGTGLGTALSMVLAKRSGSVAGIAVVCRNVVIADWLCTLPSGIAQPLTGLALMHIAGFDPWAPWLLASYVLYLMAGVCWIIVVRLQLRMARLAAAAHAGGTTLPPAWFVAYRTWLALGWPAFIGLLIVFALMVAKPG
jgi:uncharacterized membrane protein